MYTRLLGTLEYVSAVFSVFGIITHLSSAANNAVVTRYHMHNHLQAKIQKKQQHRFLVKTK